MIPLHIRWLLFSDSEIEALADDIVDGGSFDLGAGGDVLLSEARQQLYAELTQERGRRGFIGSCRKDSPYLEEAE